MKRWLLLLIAVMWGGSPALAGPLPTTGKSCTYHGKSYKDKTSFPDKDNCNTCTCYNGAVGCTEKICPGCMFGGTSFHHKQSFPSQDGCNTCTCNSGVVSCTKKRCSPCIYGKKRYQHNATFEAHDRCNQCTCFKGRVYCTQRSCQTCEYNGKNHKKGTTFKAKDGCNRCLCRRGQVYCTQRSCHSNCRYLGKRYRHGQVFTTQTKKCTCQQGKVTCLPKAPSLPVIRLPFKLKPVGSSKCIHFYYKICKKDNECKAGYRCTNFSNQCRSSICFCHKKTGKIGGCTMDCLRGFGICTK